MARLDRAMKTHRQLEWAPMNSGCPAHSLGKVRAVSSFPCRIIRALPCDRHAVHMALAQACRRDADELRPPLEFRDVLRPDIAHRGAQAARELMQDDRHRTAGGYLPLDSFRHKFSLVAN